MSLYRTGEPANTHIHVRKEQKKNFSRSKSTSNFIGRVFKKDSEEPGRAGLQTLVRAATAFRKSNDKQTLPRVSSVKGKLHLGKISKPGVIMTAEHRLNPWGEPKPISEKLINQRGLMEIINMGFIPKNVDFT